jgi:putative ABC transport system permease protein
MAPGTDLGSFNEKLTQLSVELKDKIGEERFVAEPINDIHLYSHKTFEPEVNGNAEVVYFLLIIAIFIIIIAWVNYVNLSTARAVERAREVGIRKVMGSGRGQLITQFLLESILVNLLAAGIALTLLQISLPVFRDIAGQPLPLNLIADPVFWYLLLSLLGVGTLLSGLYPAFVLSSFQPPVVLKGKLRTSSHGHWLRKGLVIFQFAATVILIACTGTVYLQLNHLRHQDLGMDINQTLALHAPNLDVPDSAYQEKLQSLKTEMLRHSEVKNVALSESLPGLSLHELSTNSGIKRLGQDEQEGTYNYYMISIGADYLPTMDIQIIAGRNFEPAMPNYNQVIINEEAMRTLGFANAEEAVGSRINYQNHWPGEPSTIIGVIKNYYQRSPKEKHLPMIFPYTASGNYLTIRLNTSEIRETLKEIENTWQGIFPNSAFDYFFLDEKYDQQYRADTHFGQVVAIFSTLAIFIACLGLFGLSSFTILQRTKEIGIRKVLGASVGQIVRLLSQDFIRLVLVASIVALPIAYFAMKEWLAGYATRISLSWWLFALPLVVVLLIALLTVSLQTIKAAVANPAESLKYE